MLVKLSLGKWSCCMPLFLCTNDKAQTADSTREVCMCVCMLDTHAYCRDEKNMASSESYQLKKNYSQYKHQSTCHEIQGSWCVKCLAQVDILCTTSFPKQNKLFLFCIHLIIMINCMMEFWKLMSCLFLELIDSQAYHQFNSKYW